MEGDRRYLDRALRQARRGEGRTAPNPPVGAVLVRDGEVVGAGFHRAAGAAHAEVVALERAGDRARGATLYVTLEPCNHHGRTPPCTEAVLAAGVRRVVIGALDPNPRVSGGGAARLREAGLEVAVGVRGAAAAALIRPWAHWLTTGRPLVTVKAAVTLDGFLATRTGDARWVTGEKARREVQRLRNACDAILVGAGTVRADDPRLTVRLRGGRDPRRVVLDGALRSPSGARVFQGGALVYCAAGADPSRRDALTAAGAEVVELPGDRAGHVAPGALLDDLGRREVLHLLVEGGGEVFASFLAAGAVDRVTTFVAPKILGGADGVPFVAGVGPARLGDAIQLTDLQVRRFGFDVCISGDVQRP